MKAKLILTFLTIATFAGAQEEEHRRGTSLSETTNEIEQTKEVANRTLTKVTVFPNPSEGEVFIEGETGTSCTVYTIGGTYIGQWVIGMEKKISLADLGTGMYVVSVLEGSERTLLKFVVL